MSNVTVESQSQSTNALNTPTTPTIVNISNLYKCTEMPISKLIQNIQQQLSKTVVVTPTKSSEGTIVQSTLSECHDSVWRSLLHIDSLTKELEVLLSNPIMASHLKKACVEEKCQIPGRPSDWRLVVTLNSIFNRIPTVEPSLF